MSWIYRISRLSRSEKEGLYRILIPPSLYHRFGIDPLSLCNEKGNQVVRFFLHQGTGPAWSRSSFQGKRTPSTPFSSRILTILPRLTGIFSL
ncbi:MAG: hypothetical protein J7M30_15645 [Deltaproteobacteria bacterium]|nr:hypothetical protein [Deltaproteobacteria bacterium]